MQRLCDNLPNRILKICSQSLATPFNLTSWKTATVIPIHKTGSQTVVQNYRPIALFPSLSKVFEKLLHKHVYSYLEYHATKFNEILFLFTFHQLVDVWRKFANSASKVIMLRNNRNSSYRKIYLFRHKARYVN